MKALRRSMMRKKDARRHESPQQMSKTTSHNGPKLSREMKNGHAAQEADVRGDFSENTFERHAAILGNARMSQPMYSHERALLVQQLQRDYGNSYVSRLVDHISRTRSKTIHTKLQVGAAGDAYEQEADAIAKQVVSMASSQGDQQTQLQANEDELRTKPIAQRQDDMDMDEDEVHLKPLIKRQDDLNDDELRMKPIARREISEDGGEVDADVENTINRARGGGQSLPENVRRSMEGAFGADFSGVKVHTGAESNALNESISARAFYNRSGHLLQQGRVQPGQLIGQGGTRSRANPRRTAERKRGTARRKAYQSQNGCSTSGHARSAGGRKTGRPDGAGRTRVAGSETQGTAPNRYGNTKGVDGPQAAKTAKLSRQALGREEKGQHCKPSPFPRAYFL